jgi:hypothetical protein
MKSTYQYHPNTYSRAILLIVVIIFLVSSCGTRTKTGAVVGAGMVLNLDHLDDTKRVVKDMDFSGKTVLVELEDGTRFDAVCDEKLWPRLQVGQKLEITPIEGSKYWKVVRIIDTPAKTTEPIMQVKEMSYSDFFPIKSGMEWVYKIEVEGGVEPVRYREQYWPFDKELQDWSRIMCRASIRETSHEEKFLQLRVKCLTTRDSLPGYILIHKDIQVIAELEIIKDDLLFFEGVKQVFWVKFLGAYQGKSISFINEIVIYDLKHFPKEYSEQGINPQGDGYSTRPLFFTAGIGLGFSETLYGLNSAQRLTFQGPVNARDEKNLFNLNFRRVIKQDEQPEITEDIIFALRRGMIELRQDVMGQTSMHLTLVRFTEE